MINLILDALDAPRAGWPGRRRYIAVQLATMVVEGLVLLILVVGLCALIVTLAAGADALPPVTR